MAFGDINREDYGQLPNLRPNPYATRAERRAAERKAAAERRSKGYTKPSLQFGSGSADKPSESSRSGLSGRSSQLAPVLEILNPQETRQMGRSATSRRGTIADELESQIEDKKSETETPPTTEYRSRREGLDAIYPDRKPNVTVTSPNTGDMPMNWAQYEVFLASKGIELANTKKQTSGFESVNLPAGSEPITSTKVFQQDGIEFDSLYGGKLRQGDMTTPELRGLGTGMAENYRPGTYGLDPQSGASSLPDTSDQSRALEVDQTQIRALPRGARQREKFLAQNPNYGQTSAPEIEKGTGISARGRAFLDAPMGAGPLELMQRTNAAQNILRKDGKIAIKDSEGKYNEISQEGYDKIRGDMRNQTEFSQEFLSQYMTTPAKPADAQSPSSIAPKPATVTSELSNIDYQAPIYTNILNMGEESVPGFMQKDREPLMRFPGIK